MHFIIETSDQLNQFIAEKQGDKCYIGLTTGNDNFHPILCDLSLLYIQDDRDKGFILCVDHSESLFLNKDEIIKALSNYKEIYVYDRKQFLYYFPDNLPSIDIGFTHQIKLLDHNTSVHNTFYNKYYFKPSINKIIPIVKHYEKQENIYNVLKDNLNTSSSEWQKDFTEVFYKIEKQGLKINNETLGKFFETTWEHYSIKNSTIYTRYNLYNTTGRPSNAFNSINFAALPKDNNCRKSFVANKGCFLLEFDYKSHHLYLLAHLIKFNINKNIYKELGKQLQIEDYDEIKKKVYHILYTDQISNYNNIEFFKKIEEYKEGKWKEFEDLGFIPGFNFTIDKKSQLLPYILQNIETHNNVERLKIIMNYIHLNQLKSRIVLYCYDSFLLQFHKSDGKNLLFCLIDLLKNNMFSINVKIGENYKEMKDFGVF